MSEKIHLHGYTELRRDKSGYLWINGCKVSKISDWEWDETKRWYKHKVY